MEKLVEYPLMSVLELEIIDAMDEAYRGEANRIFYDGQWYRLDYNDYSREYAVMGYDKKKASWGFSIWAKNLGEVEKELKYLKNSRKNLDKQFKRKENLL